MPDNSYTLIVAQCDLFDLLHDADSYVRYSELDYETAVYMMNLSMNQGCMCILWKEGDDEQIQKTASLSEKSI